MSRYEGSGVFPYEPGSNELVLANKLSVIDAREMGEIEYRALAAMHVSSMLRLEVESRFTVKMVCDLHRSWLGSIYSFAGQYRTENVSKGFTTFCAAQHVPAQMELFERELLALHTPCLPKATEPLSVALAEVHSRFIQIHPFREGNGRLGRWLAVLMAYQAGRPTLDYSEEERDRESYFRDLRRSFAGDMQPLVERFENILTRSSA